MNLQEARSVKFAIIGCGRIAQRHAQHIHRLSTLVAVCDIVVSKARELAEQYNANYYDDIDDLLINEPKVDVIAVCTPNGLHALHTIKSLKSGKHVICEKPLAITVKECEQMIAAASTANKLLFAIKQNRFNPPVVAVKKALDGGHLGNVFSIQLSCFWNRTESYYHNSWKGSQDLDGGTLFTQFSHFIDLLYWMIGDVKDVYAITKNFAHQGIIDFEDTGVVVIEFDNGAIGTINYTVNSFAKNMEGSLTIIAEKGTVKIGGQYLNELEYQQIEGYEISNLPAGNKANDYGTYIGSMSNHDKVYENLLDVLLNGSSMATNPFDGLKTVEIIEKIYKSAKQLT